MNQPGLSIFQGAGSLHLNTSAQRKEEEEELLDRERRHKEVQQRLDNEFGDLSDDNDETTNTNAGSFVGNNFYGRTSPAAGQAARMIIADTNERDNMMVRFKEQKELEDLRGRLAICESEKQRAFMARQQSHELLVESKARISEQENVVEKLKLKIKELEKQNTTIDTDLQHKQTMLSDALLKVQMIEQSAGMAAERNRDISVKKVSDRCKAQVDMMQQQIDSLRNQLDDRDREVQTITARYNELQRSREALLVEKSDTINQLSRSVEESQRQCQQLIAQNDGQHENMRLQGTIGHLRNQVDTLSKTITHLEQSLETANAELDSMASIIQETAHNSSRNTQIGHISNSTPIHDKTGLKSELSRCLKDQRDRRIELKLLQEQLAKREMEIRTVRGEQNNLLIELEKYKDECSRSAKRINIIQSDLSRLLGVHKRTIQNDQIYPEIINEIETEYKEFHAKYLLMQQNTEHLEKQLTESRNDLNSLEKRLLELSATKDSDSEQEQQVISSHLKQLEDECANLRQKYIEMSNERDTCIKELADIKQLNMSGKYMGQVERISGLESALQDAEQRCREYQQRIEEQRTTYELYLKDLESYQKKESSSSTQHSTELLKLQSECEECHRVIADLQKQLKLSNDTIHDLRHSVAMKYENDKLLTELQEKARQFDQFIQTQTAQGSPSNEQPLRCSSAPQSSSPVSSSRKDEERMAKVLAAKLKKIEDSAGAQEFKFKQIIIKLEQTLVQVKESLDIRDGEVRMLKHAILSERIKTKEMMDDRDAEVGEIFEKQQCVLDKYRDRLNEAQANIDCLKERLAQVNYERSDIAASLEKLRLEKNQWLLSQEQTCLNENHLRTVISEIETSKLTAIAEWEDKYKKAKKTAANYKKYAEAKDLHIEKENERVRLSYEQAVLKMQQKMEQLIKERP